MDTPLPSSYVVVYTGTTVNKLYTKSSVLGPCFFCFFFSLSDYGLYKSASQPRKFFNWVAIKLSTVHKFGRLDSLLTAVLYSALRYFGTSGRRSSRSPFGRSTGNDVSGH